MPGCTSRLLPKALSHTQQAVAVKQLTAMCLWMKTREPSPAGYP